MEFQKVKDLSDEDIGKFSAFFPSPQVAFVSVHQVPEILTESSRLQSLTLAVKYFSGTLCGRGFEIYREAPDDAPNGFSVNRDLYKISGSALYKAQTPFQDHWIISIPTVPLIVF